MTRWPSALALSVLLLAAAPPARAQWPPLLTQDDERAVRDVAGQMGIDDPVQISPPWVSMSAGSNRRYVTVESRRVLSGFKLLSKQGEITRLEPGESDLDLPTGRGLYRSGDWVSVGEATDVTRWRVYDGDWFTDLRLDSDNDYENARLIVLAIRSQTMVNKQPTTIVDGAPGRPPISVTDVGREAGIVHPLGAIGALSDPGLYAVSLWAIAMNSEALLVRVVDGHVECLGIMHSIV